MTNLKKLKKKKKRRNFKKKIIILNGEHRHFYNIIDLEKARTL